MKLWARKGSFINCTISKIKLKTKEVGVFHQNILSLMPGIKETTIVKSNQSSCEIKTNEGTMYRKNIVRTVEKESVMISYDEEYHTGRRAIATCHVELSFTSSGNMVEVVVSIYDLLALGALGPIYKFFGKKTIINGTVNALQEYLRNPIKK